MASLQDVLLIQDDFKLEIPRWDFSDRKISCVWGDSGSGKTTLLWLMAGLFEAKNFKMTVGGEDLARWPASKRRVGFVFQDHALFPHLSAWENIVFPAEARHVPRSQWEQEALKLVERLGLKASLSKKAAVLSGGESQRVAIARALLLKPKLLLLDEPFSSLDEKNKNEARDLVRHLNEEFQIPFVLVTHDVRDVRALAEQILVLSHGQAVTQGPTEQVLKTLAL